MGTKHPNSTSPNPNVNGGYSAGYTNLSQKEVIYVIVGGAGNRNNGLNGGSGGFNGGGNGGKALLFAGGSGGGGATHIAKANTLLKNLKDTYIANLLLVAGGAGGSSCIGSSGYGGGLNGGSTYTSGNEVGTKFLVAGATQATGYSFGQGQNAGTKTENHLGACEGNGGGGGGLFGGRAYLGVETGSNCGGSGGSGYIGTLVYNGTTTPNITSPASSSNGMACISWFIKN